ncbi:hypothetical protein JTB14_030379 [Gonioctena quinquepunctata]|nr:hypothetical protein JTB14_030379 [Gonioctena quinquepunctata]
MYSTYFGALTPQLAKQLVRDVEPPLRPKLINGKRNKLTRIDVFTQNTLITGLKVCFENGDSHMMGYPTKEQQQFYFKGAWCTGLKVWGCGNVDGMEFQFSDGRRERTEHFKNYRHQYEEHFKLEHHHIAGILACNDVNGTNKRLVNIMVAFQLTPDEEHASRFEMIRKKFWGFIYSSCNMI